MTRALLIVSVALNLVLLAVIIEKNLQRAPISTAGAGLEHAATSDPVALPKTEASLATPANASAQDSPTPQTASAPETAASSQPNTEPSAEAEDEPEPAKMPLAFADLDPSLQLDENATARLELLRQRFMTEIGGPNQNPSDPQYYDRWQKAQAELDQQTRIELGVELYNKLKMSAQRAQ